MISRIHQKLGTAGFIIAIVALVAALGGSAWAAAGLNGKEKKEVKNIAKQFAGKKGAKGAKGDTGATGATGAAGLPGAAGKDGTNGTNGTNGTDGKDGKNIETGTEATGTANCEGRGGAWVQPEGTPASRKYACAGKEGSIAATLPSGKSLTGTWGTFSEVAGVAATPVSFSVPLATVPEPVLVKKGQIGIENPTKCPGYVSGAPTAAAGVLCVYISNESGGLVDNFVDPTVEEGGGASKAGAMLFLTLNGSGPLYGTWAVKAP